jgi:chromosome segregation ATPase
LREKDNSERLDAKIKDKEEKLKELEDKHGIVGNYDEIRNFINKHDPNTIETKFYTTQDVYDKQIKKLETEKTNLKNECQEFEDKIKTLTDGFETILMVISDLVKLN